MDASSIYGELSNVFLCDTGIPVKTVSPEIFTEQMEESGNLEKWTSFVEMINGRFSGNCGEFLDYRHWFKDTLVNAINNEHYKSFNEMDMGRFAERHPDFVNVQKSIWNHSNDGAACMSVDLRQANFQAMKYVDPRIVLNCDTWEELCRKFTDCEYLVESKHIRQFVFGSLNPGRHATVERHMMGLVHDTILGNDIMKGLIGSGIVKLCAVSVDELVYKTDANTASLIAKSGIDRVICESVRNRNGFDVRVDVFTIEGCRLVSETSGRVACSFFKANGVGGGASKFVCLPQTYAAIVNRLESGGTVRESDRHFVYDGIDCIINEDFRLERVACGK